MSSKTYKIQIYTIALELSIFYNNILLGNSSNIHLSQLDPISKYHLQT